jgi:hypothetical protein
MEKRAGQSKSSDADVIREILEEQSKPATLVEGQAKAGQNPPPQAKLVRPPAPGGSGGSGAGGGTSGGK